MEKDSMSEFKISEKWIDTKEEEEILSCTSSELCIELAGTCITRNYSLFEERRREHVNVPTYPLAFWFAYNWWRLCYEPMQGGSSGLTTSWRRAHELGAADHGFAWPDIWFASDGENVTIWNDLFSNKSQSVQYLESLDFPVNISLGEFKKEIGDFVERTLRRIAEKMGDEDLAELWRDVAAFSGTPEYENRRILEAAMGYDFDECPEELLDYAISYGRQMGESTFREYAPLFSLNPSARQGILEARGILGKPQLPGPFEGTRKQFPWQEGVAAAKLLRKELGIQQNPVKNKELLDLLGLPSSVFEADGNDVKTVPCTVAKVNREEYEFLLSRRSIPGKRFELSRMIGDLVTSHAPSGNWLLATEFRTARQQRQRAFAAEFLCPADALEDFIREDDSEDTLLEAANHFQVSEKTVSSILMNRDLAGRRRSPFQYMLRKQETF